MNDIDKAIFEVGKPISKVWLHMELDFADTMKYIGGELVESEQEAKRLHDKYVASNNRGQVSNE